MTCTKDCRDCFYGAPRIYYICLNPNSSCNKECYKCCYRGEVTPEKLFDDFTKIPKNKRVNVGRIKKRFLWWPRWTPDDEIYAWFDKMYPGGLLELTRKRQIKRFGEDYVKTWEKIGKRMRSAGVSYFLSTPPDLARTRELQAKCRGHRMSIQPVDDAACLTEKDKKRLLQEFAEE